jgi:hypothetical protein
VAEPEEWEPSVLSCQPGEVNDMVARFVDLVVQRRNRATEAKEEILGPLVSGVAAFKCLYLNFFRSEGVLPPDAAERKLSVPAAAALDDFEDSHQQDERFRQDFGGDVGVEEEEEPPPPTKRPAGRRKRKKEEEEEEEDEMDPSVARTVKDVHKGWRSSIWGRLEGNLATLTKSFSAFGFNCEG